MVGGSVGGAQALPKRFRANVLEAALELLTSYGAGRQSAKADLERLLEARRALDAQEAAVDAKLAQAEALEARERAVAEREAVMDEREAKWAGIKADFARATDIWEGRA